MKKKITGVVFYQGPSMIDGKPIIGVATFGTANAKTGNLIQTWIIRSDIHPMDAINNGADSSICGNCPLRGRIADASERTKVSKYGGDTANKGRSCYVLVQNAPSRVYEAFHKGIYPTLAEEHKKKMAGKGLRYGSYGDPVAIPTEAWDELAKFCTGKAAPGYTHQWKDKRFSHWAKRVMASTHTVAENTLAASMGWRTFRTVVNIADKQKGEIVCPASEESGFRSDCAKCGACNGRKGMGDVRNSVMIVAHGGDGKLGLVEKVIKSRISLAMAA